MAEKEYIERGYLLAEYDRQHQGPPGKARKLIANAPAADVVPVRHGRWIVNDYGDIWKCSVCGVESYVDEDWRPTDDRAFKMHYCHYCGAKMDLEEGNK